MTVEKIQQIYIFFYSLGSSCVPLDLSNLYGQRAACTEDYMGDLGGCCFKVD